MKYFHVQSNVADLDTSIDLYSILFGGAPPLRWPDDAGTCCSNT